QAADSPRPARQGHVASGHVDGRPRGRGRHTRVGRQGHGDLPRHVRGSQTGTSRVSPMVRRSLLFVAAILIPAGAARGAEVEKHAITSRGKPREYYLYVPPGISADHPGPLLVTLHGSGGNGSSFPTAWKDVADRERMIVVGPNAIESARWDP